MVTMRLLNIDTDYLSGISHVWMIEEALRNMMVNIKIILQGKGTWN